MKTFLSLLIFLLSVAELSYALPLDVAFTPEESRITFEERANFNLTLRNKGPDAYKLRLFSPNFPDWNFMSLPLRNPIIVELLPQETSTLSVAFEPLHVSAIGVYSLPIHLQNIDTLQYDLVKFRVSLLSLGKDRKEYLPAVKMTITPTISVDPRDDSTLDVTLENLNRIELPGLALSIRGTIFNADVTTSLAARGEKDSQRTLQIPLEFSNDLSPQEDTLLLSLTSNGKKLGDVGLTKITILPYSAIDAQTERIDRFLGERKIVTYANKGNTRYNGTVYIPITFFERLFSRTKPASSVAKDQGVRSYAFELHLNPGESETVYVIINYIPVALVVVLLIIGTILYYLYRSPLTLSKHGTDITYRDGGISGLRVNIHLRNRSSVPVKDIVIHDKIPRLSVVEQSLSLGSLPPSSTKRFMDGTTQLIWHIDDLGAEEERMITFHMRTPLPIVGTYTLQPAEAQYTYAGRKGTIRSLRLRIQSR